MDDVGVFRTTIEVQNLDMRGSRRALPETLVDPVRKELVPAGPVITAAA